MSQAATELLGHLQYEAGPKTAALSSTTAGLGLVAQALASAFGEGTILALSHVADVSPATHPVGKETLALTAEATILGQNHHLRLEIEIATGAATTLLMVVPLQQNTWKLSTGWPVLAPLQKTADLHIKGGFVVISGGLATVSGVRTVNGHTLDLTGVSLREGLQIFGTGITKGGVDNLHDQWKLASSSGVSADLLPDTKTSPTWIEVRLGLRSLQLDAWWGVSRGIDGIESATQLSRCGIGICYALNEATEPTYSWLWRMNLKGADAIVLRATVAAGVPLGFGTEMRDPVPLGAARDAITSLLGANAASLLPDPAPEGLDLRWLQYSPGRAVSLSVEAGSDKLGAPYLLKVGLLTLRQLIYTVRGTLSGTRTTSLEIAALTEIWGVDFEVSYRPGRLIAGQLADARGVEIGAFLKGALPGIVLPFGLDTLTVSGAGVRRHLNSGHNEAQVVLSGEVDLIRDALSLREIGLEIAEAAGGAEYAMSATLKLGPVVLRVSARHDPTAGWTLEGRGQAPGGISLTALFDHLVAAFGVAVPDEMPDLKLSALALSYQTQQKILCLSATTVWDIAADVPMVSGQHSVVLDLMIAPDPATGGRSGDFSVRWTLQKGERSFEVCADLSRGNKRFEVDFHSGDTPLKLSEVLNTLGVTDDYPGKDLSDAIFQINTVSLTYQTAYRALDFAFTRELGPGVLLLELQRDNDSRRFETTWHSSQDDGALGIGDLLEVTGHGEVFDDVQPTLAAVGLSGIVEDVKGLLTFIQLGFRYESTTSGSGFDLQARPRHEALEAAFVSVGTGTSRGIVAGLSFREGKGLSDLPFLPDAMSSFLDEVEHTLNFQPRMVLFSTRASGHYLPPGFAPAMLAPTFAQTGLAAPSQPFGTAWGQLGRGLAIGGRVDFPADGVVQEVLKLDQVEGVLVMGQSSVSVQVVLGETFSVDGGADGSLTLNNAFLCVALAKEKGVQLRVGGSLDMLLFHQHVEVDAWLSVDTTGMQAHMGIQSLPSSLPPLTVLPGVHLRIDTLHPLYLSLGVQFEPPGLDLGLQGSFYIGSDMEKYKGDATFVLQMIEELPNPLYVQFDISSFDLYALCEALTGVDSISHLAGQAGGSSESALTTTAHEIEGVIDHIRAVLNDLRMDDVALHWADSIVVLPDGTVRTPGVGFRGRLHLLGWDAYANLEFSTGVPPALSGHFEMEPIHLGGVLKLTGAGAGIRKAPAKGEEVRIEAPPTSGEDTGTWYLAPGGPVFHLSTRQAPFLHADLHAELFGFIHADVTANVNEKGFDFDFQTGLGDVVDLKLKCSLKTGEDWRFAARGSLVTQVQGELGPLIPGIEATRLKIDAGFDASVDLEVTERHFRFTVRGGFHFMGAQLKVPTLTLTVPFSDLKSLAKAIWDHIVAFAEEIFEDIIQPMGEFFEDAAAAVKEVAVKAAHEVAEFAKEAAAEVVDIANKTAKLLTAGVHEMAKAAEEVAHTAEAVVAGAAEVAREAAAGIVAAAELVEREVTAAVKQGVAAVKAVGTAIAAEVAHIAAAIEDLWSRARDTAADLLNSAKVAAQRLLDNARVLAGQIKAAAAVAVAAIKRAINAVLDEIAQLEREIAQFFVNVGHEIEHGWHAFEHALLSL